MSSGLLLATATVLTATLMAAVFVASRRLDNYGLVDVAWAFGFTPVALLYAWQGHGHAPRRALIAGMMTLWSLRLGSYLYRRVRDHHPLEDGRYQALRREWAGQLGARFFAFFQLQGLLIVALSLPALLASRNPAPGLHALEWAGAALWVVALAGEALADRQLARFKADPAHRGRVCDVGLWRVSRHPNYFFEWLVWCAYFVFALPSPWGLLALGCPALMLYFLLRVTGIPATEEQALRSKGEAYRRYQRTTSAFVPWFPRRG